MSTCANPGKNAAKCQIIGSKTNPPFCLSKTFLVVDLTTENLASSHCKMASSKASTTTITTPTV